MNKKYLTLEEVQQLFSLKNSEYEKTSGLEKVEDAINKSLFKIIEYMEKGKIKVYQTVEFGGEHTFIELVSGKIDEKEEEELVKISKFLKKIEEGIGYKFIE